MAIVLTDRAPALPIRATQTSGNLDPKMVSNINTSTLSSNGPRYALSANSITQPLVHGCWATLLTKASYLQGEKDDLEFPQQS